jgi:hypothetical protein
LVQDRPQDDKDGRGYQNRVWPIDQLAEGETTVRKGGMYEEKGPCDILAGNFTLSDLCSKD